MNPQIVNALERTFLEASQSLAEKEAREREEQRRRELEAARQLAEVERDRAEEQALANRRLRRRAALLAAALIFAAVLGVTALLFAQRTAEAERLATSRELAAAAVSNLQVDAERSLLLALQALDQADTLEARNALHQALPELHLLRTLPAHEGGAVDVVFSPDGARLASIGDVCRCQRCGRQIQASSCARCRMMSLRLAPASPLAPMASSWPLRG